MDVWAFVFTAILLLVALATCVIFISDYKGLTRPRGDARLDRQQQIKAERQMARRRGRVWWRMEELHAEFLSRTNRSPAGLLPPAGGGATPSGDEGAPREGAEFTTADVREAFEAFLREG